MKWWWWCGGGGLLSTRTPNCSEMTGPPPPPPVDEGVEVEVSTEGGEAEGLLPPPASSSGRLTVVMSWMLERRLSLPPELRRMKYFCAWLATCVGVRVFTDNREMFRQSPRPYFSSPSRNSLRENTKLA